ncbi:PREDICTED: G-protein coupled receptor 35-like [Nanorana parkeri]|uniref:G-protein coupled receptor 35-like n=1 Tax=Nanorana parkeri TaxID=125878 RepID=UPI00085477DA|nr:PREDICTED: G-protein coupled receptor 35-like [Nanorana parkeri]
MPSPAPSPCAGMHTERASTGTSRPRRRRRQKARQSEFCFNVGGNVMSGTSPREMPSPAPSPCAGMHTERASTGTSRPRRRRRQKARQVTPRAPLRYHVNTARAWPIKQPKLQNLEEDQKKTEVPMTVESSFGGDYFCRNDKSLVLKGYFTITKQVNGTILGMEEKAGCGDWSRSEPALCFRKRMIFGQMLGNYGGSRLDVTDAPRCSHSVCLSVSSGSSSVPCQQPLDYKKLMPSQILVFKLLTNDSNTNCTDIMRSKNIGLDVFLLTLNILVMVFGMVFNSLAVWVFCFKMKKWTETRVFMMSLLLSDCCLLFTLPFRIYSIQNAWNLGEDFCNALQSFYYMNIYIGIFTITLISVDRYVAIKFPLRARSFRSSKKAAMACVMVWLLFLAVRLYLDLFANTSVRDPSFCFRKVNTKPLKRTLYLSVLGFCVPMIILVFCSMQIILTLKRKEKVNVQEEKDIKKTISIVTTNMVIFLLCFLPFGCGNIIRYIMESMKLECSLLRIVNDFAHFTHGLSNLNCCLDSVCYYFVAKEFWEKASLFQRSTKQLIQDQTQESSI